MATPLGLWRPSTNVVRIDPTAIDATGATLGDVLTAVSDGGGGLRAGYTTPSAGSGVAVRKNSAGSTFTRSRLNLIEGTGISLTVADDATDNEVDVTITASGGGSSGTIPTTGWSAVNGIVWNDYLVPARLGTYIVDSSSVNWRLLKRTLSGASTYDLKATLRGNWTETLDSQALGIAVYDGTKLITLELLSQSNNYSRLRAVRWNSVNAANSVVAGPTGGLVPALMTLRIVKDATNRTFYYWAAGGWVQFYQEAASAFLTETDIGFGGISNATQGGSGVEAELLDWSVT